MYNYGKLIGAMAERGVTREQLAKSIGISPESMSNKLNNKQPFKQAEMVAICVNLGESLDMIQPYFFTLNVQEA